MGSGGLGRNADGKEYSERELSTATGHVTPYVPLRSANVIKGKATYVIWVEIGEESPADRYSISYCSGRSPDSLCGLSLRRKENTREDTYV